jgi:hypothetical protein
MRRLRFVLLGMNVVAGMLLATNVARADDETAKGCCRMDTEDNHHCCAGAFCCQPAEPECTSSKKCSGAES